MLYGGREKGRWPARVEWQRFSEQWLSKHLGSELTGRDGLGRRVVENLT